MAFFSNNPGSNTGATAAADKDIEVADPPADSISSLSFSSQADYLAVGSWDNNVCSYLVTGSILAKILTARKPRSVSTRWGVTVKRKERLCTRIKDQC